MRRLYFALRRIRAIAGKEILHVLRDPRTLVLALAMPVLLLLLFGYGVSFDLEEVPLVVVDLDGTATSRLLAERLDADGDLEIVRRATSSSHVEEQFRRDQAIAAVVIPAGLSESLATGRATEVQVLADAADNNTATQALNKIDAALRAAVASLAPATAPAVAVAARTYFNPEARSALYLVPGLVAYIMAIVAVLLTALTVAREWERGSMQQLFATPVGRLEIVVGKLLPYLVLGIMATLLVLAAGAWVFGVPLRGSLPLLATVCLLFLTAMLAQGLLISIVTRDQMVATQAATMSSMLPVLLLSGFLFPIDNMPVVIQWVSAVLPARYFVEALRGIMLRGNGLAELWPETLALAGFAAALVGLSAVRFQRRLA